MERFLQSLITGVLTGGIYSLVAVGLSLIFGVLKVINFVHGSMLMVGMFAAYGVSALLGLNVYLGTLLVVPALFLFGFLTQKSLINPLIRRERAEVVEPISALLLTIGIGIFLDNIFLLIFGADFRSIPGSQQTSSFYLGDIVVDLPRLYALAAAIGVAIALQLLLGRTELGRIIQATSQDRDAAVLQGINVFRVYAITFGIGVATLGIAACFIAPFYYIHPSGFMIITIRAYMVVVVGGLGSIAGAIAGGIFVGLIESLGSLFVTATSADIFVFILFVLILLLKPSGLMGRDG